MFERFIARARLVSSFPFELFSSFFIEDEKKNKTNKKMKMNLVKKKKKTKKKWKTWCPRGITEDDDDDALSLHRIDLTDVVVVVVVVVVRPLRWVRVSIVHEGSLMGNSMPARDELR